MEILDIYDKLGNRTNKTTPRGNKNLQDDEYIKIVVVWIKCQGKWLIQKCSAEKGEEYAVTGGHIPSGHTAKNQAKIEIMEELGLSVDENCLEYLGTITRGHALLEVYLYENNTIHNYPFVLQEEEVESIHWLNNEEIDQLIEQGLLRQSSQAQYEKYIKNK